MLAPAPRRGFAAILLAATITAVPMLAAPAEARPLAPATSSALAAPLPEQDHEVLFFDDFEDASVGLLPGGSDAAGNFAVGYEGGEYVIYQANPEWENFPLVRVPGIFDNATLIADIRMVGPTDGRFLAFGCRDQETDYPNEYRLLMTPYDQEYALLRISDGDVAQLVEWQPTPAMRRNNGMNTVELSCVGSKIGVSINGITISSIEDPSFQSGRFWIGTGMLPGGVGTAEARIDALAITAG